MAEASEAYIATLVKRARDAKAELALAAKEIKRLRYALEHILWLQDEHDGENFETVFLHAEQIAREALQARQVKAPASPASPETPAALLAE